MVISPAVSQQSESTDLHKFPIIQLKLSASLFCTYIRHRHVEYLVFYTVCTYSSCSIGRGPIHAVINQISTISHCKCRGNKSSSEGYAMALHKVKELEHPLLFQ